MSEPEAIGASIQQLRVECIGMALAINVDSADGRS
jgi:hypothetical protein